MGAAGGLVGGTAAAPGLLAALRRAVDRAADGRIGVSILFSGGIDSSLLARLFSQRVPTDLVCVGFPKSPDVETGRVTAELLQLPITIQLLSDANIEDALGRWHEELE